MGNRLTKIYTRTGDAGTTGLADGSRVAKDAPRIEAIGAVDELNSVIGVLLCEDVPDAVRKCLDGVQHDLFDLGGELSVPGHAIMLTFTAYAIVYTGLLLSFMVVVTQLALKSAERSQAPSPTRPVPARMLVA